MRLTFCFSRNCRPYPASLGRLDCPCCPGTKLRFSIAHFSVKQRRPFKNSFCPSRRHRRQTASRCLANFYSPSERLDETLYTRRRFGGRHPLCGIGVTSRITTMCNPAAARARTADSRPEPGPFTRTSTLFIPYWSRATPAAESEACCAAYGVPLREPLKPIAPADDQHTARPSVSVMVTWVLLNVAWMCATPCGTTRRSRFFLNSFLRFAGFAGAPVSGAAPCCSFATCRSVSCLNCAAAQFGCRGQNHPFFPTTFFFAATAPRRGPFRVRALVCVRCPRTGRLRRCRMPR